MFDFTSPSGALTALLDAVPTAVFLKDTGGAFVAVNRAYERLYGLGRERIVGKTVYDLYPTDLADRYTQADLALYATDEVQVYEVPMLSVDGSRHETVVSKSIVRGASGAALGLIGTITDLSAQRSAERALRELNERLEESVRARTEDLARTNAVLSATLECTDDGILVLDPHGEVLAANARFLALWGLTGGATDERALLQGVRSKVRDPDGFTHHLAGLLARPEEQGTYALELADGRRFESCSLPLRLGGEARGRVWNFRDVTRERELEREMRHAQKMEAVGRLAGGIAHDFNNLLTVIFANSNFVAEALEPEHPAQADVREVIGAADRAARLTNQLLTFSRKQVVNARSVDVCALLDDMRRMLERLLGEDVSLVVRCEAPGSHVRADVGQLEQVIANLCVNARDAMPSGGALVLAARPLATGAGPRRDAPGIEIAVSDDGVGMTAEVRERAFEPFFTTKERGKGTGLGLSTVFGIVAQHGGTVDVQSAPNQGTTVRVVLPRDETPDPLPTRTSAPRPAPRARILLVEDEEALRRAIARHLTHAGHTVIEAGDGLEAGALCAQGHEPFDLLLTDVVMPHKSGVELAREVTAQGKARRVLFMSGFTAERDKLPVGASLVPKPFTVGALLARVDEELAVEVSAPASPPGAPSRSSER